MKKLFAVCIVLLFVLTLFFACKSNEKNKFEKENCLIESSSGLPLDSHQIEAQIQYIRIGSNLGPRYPVCTVISSMNELEQYSNNAEYKDAVSKYSDEYFLDNFLVIIIIEETSGSNRHKVERVDRNGDIIIEQLIPEIGTSDMATWNIIIELKNSQKLERFQVVLE